MNRRYVILFLLITVSGFAGGCMHKDPAVDKAIQARYGDLDGAFARRDIEGILALCSTDYSETNKGMPSVRPKNWDTVAVTARARRKANRANEVDIDSPAQYREFLTEYLSGIQSLSVRSEILREASVNKSNDRAMVTISREVNATIINPANNQPFPLLVKEQASDTWVKDAKKGWLRQNSEVTMSSTQKDRLAEGE